MLVFSFDCAIKSLGICIMKINKPKTIDDINTIFDIKYIDSVNLGDYDNPWTTAKSLKSVLKKLNKKYGNPDTLLYEFQMNANDKSRMISNFIAYEYSDICKDIRRVMPTLKNKIYFHKDLKHSEFLKKNNSSYTANKKHTTANMKYYFEIFNLELPNKKKLDDMADAFMMIFTIFKEL